MAHQKSIGITGVAGFIGSNLAASLLKEGYHVIGIDNLSAGLRSQIPEGCEFHLADIRSDKLGNHFNGCEIVFHLAAKNCLKDCEEDPITTAEINVVGTLKVIEAASKTGVRGIVFADSSAVYEGCSDFPSHVEETSPISFYAKSKSAAAEMGRNMCTQKGLSFTALRYFNVYGPHQDNRRTLPPLMISLIDRIAQGKPPLIFGAGTTRRDFIYVEDINRFHLKLIQQPELRGRTYNLGTGENISVLEVLEVVEKVLGKKIPAQFEPEPTYQASITLADISETLKTGWAPLFDIESGIREMTQEMIKPASKPA